MANTGIKRVLTLRKFVDGVSTPSTKTNDKDDQDYVADFFDASCLAPGQTTTTTTTTTSTTTTTTTSSQDAVGKIAAVTLCTGSNGSCTSNLDRQVENVVYIKIKSAEDNYTTYLKKSRTDVGSLYNNKYVIDNSPKNLRFLEGSLSGYIYNRSEGIVDEATVINSPETIDATNSSGQGDYLVSAISLLDAGSDPTSSTETFYPKNAPLMTLGWSQTEGRMTWILSNCFNTGGSSTIDNDMLGGDGENSDNLIKGNDSLVDGSHEDAAQEQ